MPVLWDHKIPHMSCKVNMTSHSKTLLKFCQEEKIWSEECWCDATPVSHPASSTPWNLSCSWTSGNDCASSEVSVKNNGAADGPGFLCCTGETSFSQLSAPPVSWDIYAQQFFTCWKKKKREIFHSHAIILIPLLTVNGLFCTILVVTESLFNI